MRLAAPPLGSKATVPTGAKVTVTNLDENLTREQVASHFAAYGRVVDVYRPAPGPAAAAGMLSSK